MFRKVQYSCGFEGCQEANLAEKKCKMVFRAYFSKMKNGINAEENTPIYILQSGIPDLVYYAVRYTSRVYYVVQYIFIYINTGIPDSRGIPFLIIKYILQSGILRLYTRLSGIHTDHFAIQFSRCFAMPYKCIAIIIIPRMLYKVNR